MENALEMSFGFCDLFPELEMCQTKQQEAVQLRAHDCLSASQCRLRSAAMALRARGVTWRNKETLFSQSHLPVRLQMRNMKPWKTYILSPKSKSQHCMSVLSAKSRWGGYVFRSAETITQVPIKCFSCQFSQVHFCQTQKQRDNEWKLMGKKKFEM